MPRPLRDQPTGSGLRATLHLRAGQILLRLRDLVGPRVTLGVRLAAFDTEGRVFLVRHSYVPGLHLPGGAVDPHETCREAVVREAREEGGLELAAPPDLFAVYRNLAAGRHDHVLLYVARGVVSVARPRLSLEIRASGFHPVASLPAGVTAATRTRVAEVLEGHPPDENW